MRTLWLSCVLLALATACDAGWEPSEEFGEVVEEAGEELKLQRPSAGACGCVTHSFWNGGTVCHVGNTTDACGAGGETCAACSSGDTCVAGDCVVSQCMAFFTEGDPCDFGNGSIGFCSGSKCLGDCSTQGAEGRSCDDGEDWVGTCTTYGNCCWSCPTNGVEGGACPYTDGENVYEIGTCQAGMCCWSGYCQQNLCLFGIEL